MTIGILTGMREEADAFRPGQGKMRDAPFYLREVGGVLIASAGIGKVNAALAVAALAQAGAKKLIIIGTAGRLDPDLDGDTFWLSHAIQHDYGAARADGFRAYVAGTLPIGEAPFKAFEAVRDPGLGLPHARIASGDSFVECPTRAAALRDEHQVSLVDMETGALAQAAARLGLPWAGIKATSDNADGDSAATFEANLAAAAKRAADAAERMLNIWEA